MIEIIVDEAELDILSPEQGDKDNCKGIVFRYTKSAYLSSHHSIEYRQSLRILKRQSCSGCNYCQQFWEDFSMTGDVEATLRLPKKLENGFLYKAVFVSGGTDFETGYCDDWWWELEKVET